jgi:hypothetical protein
MSEYDYAAMDARMQLLVSVAAADPDALLKADMVRMQLEATPQGRVRKLTEYAQHCARMGAQYAHSHPRWLFYTTMSRAKEIQARYWERKSETEWMRRCVKTMAKDVASLSLRDYCVPSSCGGYL